MPDTQISEALGLIDGGLQLLLAAVHADDPKREMLVRVGDLLRDVRSLQAALSGHVVGWQQAAMAQFIMWCMNEGPWDGCDLYGGDVQDKAEELGLIVKTKFDPKIHGERIEAEEGGDWFIPAEWLLSALPAPPVQEMEG